MPEKNETGQIVFRPMILEDLEQVAAIDRASFPTPWPKDAFLYELKHQRISICRVAEYFELEKKKIIVAAIVIWLIVDEAHIGTLAVKPGFRGQKIAQRLLAHSLIECYQQGARQALLEVRQTNLAAQNLYYKFDFKPVGLRHDYYKDTHEDAILMTLSKFDLQKLARLAQVG